MPAANTTYKPSRNVNCAGMYNKYADAIYLVHKYSIVVFEFYKTSNINNLKLEQYTKLASYTDIPGSTSWKLE